MNSIIFMGLFMLVFFLGVLAYVVWDEKPAENQIQVKFS